jgi:hypothetical protein
MTWREQMKSAQKSKNDKMSRILRGSYASEPRLASANDGSANVRSSNKNKCVPPSLLAMPFDRADVQASTSTRASSGDTATEDGSPSSLSSSDTEGEPDSANIAELTRPKRGIMSKVPKDLKGRGRKRKHEAQERGRINWKHLLVFSLIREAQVEVRRIDRSEAWSPSAIVKRCQAKSFKIFEGLTSQVVGRWIDQSDPSPKWSAEILADVQLNGNTPHAMSTRTAILDSTPELKKEVINQLRSM